MRRPLALFSTAILLGACTPLSLYYKPGAAVKRMERDMLNCKVTSASKVPVNTQTRVVPGPFISGRRVCNAAGQCRTRPGHFAPDRIIMIDTNETLRGQVTAQCMTDQGYEQVKIPHCKAGIKTATPGQTAVLPRLTPTSCVIRSGQSWQIVDPG